MDIISITEWENDKEYNDNVMIRTLRHQLEQKESAIEKLEQVNDELEEICKAYQKQVADLYNQVMQLKVRPLGNTDLYAIDRAEFDALREKYGKGETVNE